VEHGRRRTKLGAMPYIRTLIEPHSTLLELSPPRFDDHERSVKHSTTSQRPTAKALFRHRHDLSRGRDAGVLPESKRAAS